MKNHLLPLSTAGPNGCSDSLAAQKLLLAVQVEIQRLLNERGMRYKDLACILAVTEARVSQMFAETASNMTVKTIAKVFNRLGEEAYIATASSMSDHVPLDDCHEYHLYEIEELGDLYIALNASMTPLPRPRSESENMPRPFQCAKAWAEAERTSDRAA